MVWRKSVINLGMLNHANPFKRSSIATEGVISLTGVVLDVNGKPLERMAVFAYTAPSLFGRPLFVSDRSEKEGNYVLRVAGRGKYYFRARSNYGGGQAGRGELMGVYAKGKPVTVRKGGAAKGINIARYVIGM